MFSEDFCHPATVNKDTAETQWSICIEQKDAASCSLKPGCIYSDGKELIPDHDFCAPMDLTSDVALIQTCVAADVAAACNAGCQWRHGKDNTTVPTTPVTPAPGMNGGYCLRKPTGTSALTAGTSARRLQSTTGTVAGASTAGASTAGASTAGASTAGASTADATSAGI